MVGIPVAYSVLVVKAPFSGGSTALRLSTDVGAAKKQKVQGLGHNDIHVHVHVAQPIALFFPVCENLEELAFQARRGRTTARKISAAPGTLRLSVV